jgi:hypothetical protein
MSETIHEFCPFGPTAIAYLSRDLSAAAMLAFERHLAGCPECFEYVSELRQARAVFQEFALMRRLARPVPAPVLAAAAAVPVAAEDWFGIKAALAYCVQGANLSSALQQSLRTWVAQLAQTQAEALKQAAIWIEGATATPLEKNSMPTFGAIFHTRLTETFRPELAMRGKSVEPQVPTRGDKLLKDSVAIQTRLQNERLTVEITGISSDTKPFAIVLIPKDNPNQAQALSARRVGEAKWVASFDRVTSGEYALALEPLPGAAGP